MLQPRFRGLATAFLLLITASSPAVARPFSPARPSDSLLTRALGDETSLGLPGEQAFHQTSREIEDPRIVALPGAGRLAVWRERDAQGVRALYAVDPDGSGFRRVRETSYELALKRVRFTPVERTGALVGPTFGHAGELHLVQFLCPPTPEMLSSLEQLGARVHQFVPSHARIVRMNAPVLASVEALDFVRWVGPYLPEYRVEGALLSALESGAQLPTERYRVQVLERGLEQQIVVAERIATLGGQVESTNPDGFVLEATMSAEALIAIAQLDAVLWVERAGRASTDMSLVRQTGGAAYLELVTGFTGEGVRGEVMDDNVRASHNDFQSDPFLFHGGRSGNTDHGTKVAGCLFGDGSGSMNSRGVLPDAQPIFADYHQLGNRYNHTAQLLQAPYEAVFQSNSWGNTQTTQYTSRSMELDDIAFQHDITIVQSQSNTGTQLSRPEAWSKNVLSVGGVDHQNTASLADDVWGNTGSIGPAADGRVKPDLCFFYESIQTTDDESDSSYTTSFGGTSAATPCVAGFVGLAQEMWSDAQFGNAPVGGTIFERRAKATTIRALLINSARQYNFSGTTADMTRTHQGWGLPNVKRLHQERATTFVVNEEHVLRALESKSFALNVLPGQAELRATLVYLDLPGTTSASLHRVNDLSLKVSAPDGKNYWGNNGLLTGNWSLPGGQSNTRDVIENVFLQNPAPGTWVFEVFADELNGDAHLETPEQDCDFALVVSGVERPANCPAPIPYCSPKPTSIGSLPFIGSAGMASVASNNFELTLQGGIPNQYAIAFSGDAPASTPFMGGTLCIQGPLVRRAPLQLDGVGSAEFPIDLAGQTPGVHGYFQIWFRDPADPTGFSVGFSDGLEVVYCP